LCHLPIDVPGGGKVPKQEIIEIGAARKASTTGHFTLPNLIRELPDLPVFSETLLKLELAAHERPVELARVSDLLLSDPGAAIQVMRLAGRNWEGGGHPERIEDGIAGVGVQACLDAVSKHILTRRRVDSAIVEAWEHARVIAYLSGLLAQEMGWDAPPGDARWVGLCHEIGSFPAILGWGLAGEHAIDLNLAGLLMAQAWSLPRCVVEYFSDCLNAKSDSPWMMIVDHAHQMVERAMLSRKHICLPLDFDLQQAIPAV
jgi:hypothetical protein